MLRDRYCQDRGRPAEDPELMFKICLLEYLYNLSDVQVIEHIRVNLAYRWFLALNMDEELPDDSTISYFRVNRVGLDKFKEIFDCLIEKCIKGGLIQRQANRAIIDATHIIANVAIPTWLSLVRQAIEKVIVDLRLVNQSTAEGFQQRYKNLLEALKGKTRDEKLPYVLEIASELAQVAEKLLDNVEDQFSPIAYPQKGHL